MRLATIQYENRVLLDKMMEIERKQSQLNPAQIAKRSFHPTKSLHTSKRINELRKINQENRVNFLNYDAYLFLGLIEEIAVSSFCI